MEFVGKWNETTFPDFGVARWRARAPEEIKSNTPITIEFEILFRPAGSYAVAVDFASPADLVAWVKGESTPKKYPGECPCGINARGCDYHKDM